MFDGVSHSTESWYWQWCERPVTLYAYGYHTLFNCLIYLIYVCIFYVYLPYFC